MLASSMTSLFTMTLFVVPIDLVSPLAALPTILLSRLCKIVLQEGETARDAHLMRTLADSLKLSIGFTFGAV